MIAGLRYERKYKVERMDFRPMIHELILHPAGFVRHHPDRIINNVYFDTPELMTLKDNLAGVSERRKYRLRWYGKKPDRFKKGRWETKYKFNTLGTKLINSFEGKGSLEDFSRLEEMVNDVYRFEHHLVPTLVNRYVRSYYISADGNYRMTIDREMDFFPICGARRFTRYTHFDPAIVLEFKYEIEMDEKADEILSFIPYQQTKSSKYVTGMLMGS